MKTSLSSVQKIRELLCGDPQALRRWLDEASGKHLLLCLLTITFGCVLYGATVGYWRSPEMGLYVGIKMPLLIFLTLLCNGLLNGIFGLLLGSGLGFRQSLLALLMSFTVASLLLGALAPVTFFIAHNAPTPDSASAKTAHASYLLTHTLLISYAGLIANLHLYRLLVAVTPTPQIAQLTLLSWLAGNAFVGAQFSWILRPFFGSPNLEVAFLRDDPMHGTFYEAVWRSLNTLGVNFSPALLFFFILIPLLYLKYKPKK